MKYFIGKAFGDKIFISSRKTLGNEDFCQDTF